MELPSVSHINNVLDINETNNFLTKYHSINSKLKKRFMRNPNATDASDQFIALAAQCEHEENWQYAGICYLAASRCYHSLGITGSTINCLLKAGKYFLHVHKQSANVGCPSIGLTDLQAAFSTVNDIEINCENISKFNAIIAGFVMELAYALGPTPASGQLLRKAINICPTMQAINILIFDYLKQDDYTTALNVATDFINLIETVGTSSEYYRKYLHKAEVNRLILILMLHQTSRRLVSPFAEIVEKYTLASEAPSIGANISEDEYLALQSLILACRLHDHQALLELEVELWKYMDSDQKNFLRTLIRIVTDE